MTKWKIVKLGTICTKISSGATPTGGKSAYKPSGIALIRSQNILDFAFDKSGLAFIDDIQANKLNNVEVCSGDILLNITGDSVARCCIVPNEYLPARVNQHVMIIRPDDSVADNRYIFYFLQYVKSLMLQLSSAGATRKALTKKMIEELEIPLPSLAIQKSIGDTLSILDDKIEKNRKINHHLVA
ncbi:restriction endonuclease subunit S [Streptococcaceae bacterium ESL0729]|nr:restriction endonuclease subunit S [Streptococcaceae bacterium ESL0729]